MGEYVIIIFYLLFGFLLMFVVGVIRTFFMIKNAKRWDPFKLWAMTIVVKRKDGTTFSRLFKRFEYIGQETEEGIIIGIYFSRTKPKSKKELKYEAMVKKWK